MERQEVLQTNTPGRILFEKRVLHAFFVPLVFLILGWGCSSESNEKEAPDPDLQNSNVSVSTFVIPSDTLKEGDSTLSYSEKGQLLKEDSLYSGVICIEYPTGGTKYARSYYKGKLQDTSYAYYEDGDLMHKRYYEQGKKQGWHLGWYRDGKKKYARYFEKGKNEGNHKEWYPNGQLYKDQNYKYGKEFGPQKIYRPDGKLRGNYVVREDGKKFGLLGLKRCEQVDTKDDEIEWKTLRNRDSANISD